MKTISSQRIESVISRLSAKNRWRWAARIYGDWLESQRGDASICSPPAASQMYKYGRLLRNAGDIDGATTVFRELALAMAGKDTGSMFFLHRSFDEWAKCLEDSGSPKSADETRALGNQIAARREQENGGPFKTLAPSRLIRPIASRCTFILSLEWESPSETFHLFNEDGFLTLRERFRSGEPPGAWLEFEAKAPAEPDPTYPHVAVCVKLPWRFVDAGHITHALALVNEVNRADAACSTCLEPESGQIAVRSRMGFAGFNSGTEPMGDFSTAQEEATLNMLLEVVGTASAWEQRVAELASRLHGDAQPGLDADHAQHSPGPPSGAQGDGP